MAGEPSFPISPKGSKAPKSSDLFRRCRNLAKAPKSSDTKPSMVLSAQARALGNYRGYTFHLDFFAVGRALLVR